MEQYVSFHKLMDYLKQEQVNSPRLNDFGYGDVVYFINDSGTTVTYPFLFVTPVNITYAENTTTYSLQMIFADIVNTDLSNEIDVVSDMSLEARRFLSVVKRGFLMDKVDVTLPSIANSFFERFNDHVGGVVLNADIVVFEDINACDPYPSPTPSVTPTITPTSTPINITPTPTNTPTSTLTPTPSITPTSTTSPTPSLTPTHTPTPSITPTQTITPTPTLTPTPTPSPLAPASITYITQTGSDTNATSYNFTGVDIGGPGLIALHIGTYVNGIVPTKTITGVTINGVSASLQTITHNGDFNFATTTLAYARITSGTTATIDIQFGDGAGTPANINVGVWRIQNNTSDTPYQTQTNRSGSNTQTMTFTSLPTNSVGIMGIAYGSSRTSSPSWTNATGRYTSTIELAKYAAGDFTSVGGGNLTITTTWSTSGPGGNDIKTLGMAWS
jgi:hypothetical protein